MVTSTHYLKLDCLNTFLRFNWRTNSLPIDIKVLQEDQILAIFLCYFVFFHAINLLKLSDRQVSHPGL